MGRAWGRSSPHLSRVPVVLIGVALTLLAVLVACGGGGSGKPSEPPGSLGAALNRRVPSSIANLPLTTDTGRTTSLAAWHGKTIVLTDFLTLCPDTCPLVSQNYAAMDHTLKAAGVASKVQLVELTVDPQRDTPARLHAYRRLFGAPANWALLTATPGTIKKVWAYFGAYYQRSPDPPPSIDWWTHKPLTYDVEHSDDLFYIDPQGHERFVIQGTPHALGKDMPAAMNTFLDSLGQRHLNAPMQSAWTAQQALQPVSWILGKQLGSG